MSRQHPTPWQPSHRNGHARPAEAATQAQPNGKEPAREEEPQTGPILSETPWNGKLARARAHVAVVVVYHRGDHHVIWPHERSRVFLHRRPATVYEVDLGLHQTVITADLPGRDYAGIFHATISVQWRVFDPSAVVRHRVLNIEETLSATLLRRAREIARDFAVGQVRAAEDEINDRLGGVTIDVGAPTSIQQAKHEATHAGCLGAEYGLWTRAITHLTLDDAALEHNTKLMKLNWAIEEEEAEQRLRVIKNRNEHEITAKRIEVYREIIAAGDVERFSLRLASHPDEISDITAIIREDQLTSRRDTIEFISHMVDSGVVERWEVGDQVRQALEWLKDATTRAVTDKDHRGTTDQTGHHRRQGRGAPIEESAASKPPPDTIVVSAETVVIKDGAASEPPPRTTAADTELGEPQARQESAEHVALPPADE
jgi:hypothetical protein